MDIKGNSGQLLLNLMSASTRRAEVLSNNIANQNTPGFKRSTVAFEDLLQAEMQRGNGDLLAVAPQEMVDMLTPTGGDGNNVTMELEVNAMNQNRLLFETYATIFSGRMELLRASIEEGR